MKLKFYQDPGHGWVKVQRKFLKKLEIADKISSCSLMRGDDIFLEEDCDLTLFCDTMEKQGITFSFEESHTNKSSKIRSYDSYINYTPEEEQEIKSLRTKMLAYSNWNKQSIYKIKRASLESLKFWQGHYKNFTKKIQP